MAELISRIYANFRGVDFRGDEVDLTRSPDSLNMWKDYKGTDGIRTRPYLEQLWGAEGPVYGIFYYDRAMIVHCGTSLYAVWVSEGVKLCIFENVQETKSVGFVFDNAFYFMDGKNYLKYKSETAAAEPVEGYIPTTSISRDPRGGGKMFEDVNILSDYRKNSFRGDGESLEYFLDTQNIDEDYVPQVWIDDFLMDEVEEYSVDYERGCILFRGGGYYIPPKPDTEGQDNVVVQFKKAVKDKNGDPKRDKAILKCTMAQLFDNRVFFSGNPSYPNTVWHCSLNDPSYVSDLDYYREGLDDAKVTGMVAGNNALWVFRAPSEHNTTIFYHTPSIDSEYGKVYPSVNSSIATGCIGKAINFNDDIVFFSPRGMEGISGDVTTEQAVAHRSSLVDRKLIAEPKYRDMVLTEWEGYLLVFVPFVDSIGAWHSSVYLADSRAMYQNVDHGEYEWFYWVIDKKVNCATVYEGKIYIGTDSGVYTFTYAPGEGIWVENLLESYWVTPKDKFKYPHKLKTSNKRGCVAEAKGDITVFAKTEDTEFEAIGRYENVTDYFVSRIKRKKWKDIQLKFYSLTGFSLETCTLEAWVGGYIKR